MNDEALLNYYTDKYNELGLDDLNYVNNRLCDDFEYNKSNTLDNFNYTFFKKNQRKYTDFSSNIVYHPNITKFKKVKKENKRHTNFLEKTYEYPIDMIHLMKPKINIIQNKISDTKVKYYISMIQNLYKISESESIKKLKNFDGDVYKTILFG